MKIPFDYVPVCSMCGYKGKLHETLKNASFRPQKKIVNLSPNFKENVLFLTCPICLHTFEMATFEDKPK